jgi:xanthosine utilization system XapX-like protein
MEAVVFVGGVSLGQPAASIPIAAVVGLVCGIIVGFVIYEFASRTSKSFNLANKQTSIQKVFFPPPLISSKCFPRCHDQLPSPHRSRSIQQSRRFL